MPATERTCLGLRARAILATFGLSLTLFPLVAAEQPLLRFVQWNDLHVDSSNADYRLANEKVDYLVSSLNAQTHFPVPDFVIGVGDLITGEGSGIPKLTADFNLLKRKLAGLKCPFYPVMGNHENIQGEGDPQLEAPYREAFGADRVNYTFEAAGIQFVMLNDSGAPASNRRAAGKARRDWLRRVFEKSPDLPKIICAHIPLVPVRDPEVLAKSFVYGSETTQDGEMLELVTNPANKVVAVLSAHLHLTGVTKFSGIHQIVVSGTASYPCDYACYEVFSNRIHVQMLSVPQNLLTPDTDIYAPPLRPMAYTDPSHLSHYSYLAGNPSERSFDIDLKNFPTLNRKTGERADHIGGPSTVLAVGRPGELWRSATPEAEGFSAVKLEALRADLAARRTKAFLVIRNDAIVCEWYAPDSAVNQKHGTASLAKALVGGLSLAVAMSDGRLTLDDPAAKFIPPWRDDPRKSRITLRQLGSHTSGVEDAEADGKPHEQLTGWKGDFWKRLPVPNDPFTIARDRAPLVFEPGAKMQYSNPGIALMTYGVTAALRNTQDIRSLLRERVMRPMGVADAEWSVGYGQTFTVDGLPLVASWGGGAYTARAAARVGRLMLRRGDWDGQRLLSAAAVRLTTADAGTPGPCGIGWWSNSEGDCDKLPRDAFFGSGAGHQILLVVPSLNLIVVRFGGVLANVATDPKSYHEAYSRFLFEPLIASMTGVAPESVPPRAKDTSANPAPPSPVITRIVWAPKETITRRARGSDNWPMTWADDDALYTAFGDGHGFEPFTPEKLSLGLARITGGPADGVGLNLRSPSGEARGDGAKGKKASGLLCVEGVLYLLARNAGNAQLAWSSDHGSTWMWADWKFTTSFGCPTFLNFGMDYVGARDEFVYIYSPDGSSAYERADRMVLARAPKNRLRERAACEFFVRLDPRGQPVWTKEIAQRGAVFTHSGRCYRSGVTYYAPLRRYLWCVTLPVEDKRVAGGLTIYDAPEPWGPWTVAFATETWDVAPGESASFPTKWMSGDGRTLHLVFSGDDSFCVRKATLILNPSADR